MIKNRCETYAIQNCRNIKRSTFKRGALDRRVRIRRSSILLSTTSNAIQSHAFLQHSLPQTFLKSTCLARFPSAFIYLTLAIRRTSILDVSCKITSYFIVIYTVQLQIAPTKFSNVTMLRVCKLKVQIYYIYIFNIYVYSNCITIESAPSKSLVLSGRIIAAYYGNRYEARLPCIVLLKKALHASHEATP